MTGLFIWMSKWKECRPLAEKRKMKQKVVIAGIKLIRLCMSAVYALLKFVLPTDEKKIVFISRQSNDLPLDFKLLKEKLEKQDWEIKIHAICCRVDDHKENIIKFAFETLCSMYHLSMSKVCVVDSYWPAVSMLKHKKTLTIFQMWHALGAIKKFGFQTLGKNYGRDTSIAKAMSMHCNYDYVIAGGKEWNKYYCEAFNITPEKILNIGLPRIDYLLESEPDNKKKIYLRYPQFAEKPVILYAPTFRRNKKKSAAELINKLDLEKYNVVVKSHPNQPLHFDDERIYYCPEFSTMELLSVCEFLITDYSAVALEAAILRKKTLYYLYDHDDYIKYNGLNVDPLESMPGCAFEDAGSLIEVIKKDRYNNKQLEIYRNRFLPSELGTSSAKLANIIHEVIK